MDPVPLFYTAPFTPASRSHLESTLSAASEYLQYQSIYDPAFDGLSPADIFKRQNHSFPPHGCALLADDRTLTELHSNATPTVLVVSPCGTSPQKEWQRYSGPGDISLLTHLVRLALLRALAEERATGDPHTDAWFWGDPKGREYTDKLWMIKTLRAAPVGAGHACAGYAVKDIADMHALYSRAAATSGGVFRGLY